VEGAVVLMEKIGHMIDEKLSALYQKLEEGKETAIKDTIVKTFARLDDLVTESSKP